MNRKLFRIVVCAMLGGLMFVSKILMELLPNVHLLALLITVATVRYRRDALVSVYVYVMLDGLVHGFSAWWVPYLYIWTVLWAAIMLLPKNMNPKAAVIVYSTVCGLHGLCFGLMYAPVQALLFGLDMRATALWVAAGLPFDAVHAVSNMLSSMLAVPLIKAITAAENKMFQ